MAVYRLGDERGLRYSDALALIANDPDILEHSRRKTIAAEVTAIGGGILDGLGDTLKLDAADGLEGAARRDRLPERGGA